MSKLLSFLFLTVLYAYITYSNQLDTLNPVVSIVLYIAGVFGCAVLLVQAKKERTKQN